MESGCVASDYEEWSHRYRTRIEPFRAIHRGRTGFLLGNGPSLNEFDPGRLQGVPVIGTNRIFRHLSDSRLALTYYVAVNRLKISAHADSIAALDSVCFLSHQQWDRSRLPESEHRIPIFTDGAIGQPAVGNRFQGDLMQPMPVENTVSFVALQIAYFLGFSNIVLLGFDHRFSNTHPPNTLIDNGSGDPDRLEPGYQPNEAYYAPDPRSYEIALGTAREHFEAAGRRIVNATPGSALTTVPRISIADALALAG